MVLWGLIRPSRLQSFANPWERFYSQIYATCVPRIHSLGLMNSFKFFPFTRSFAAPVQARQKPEAKDYRGPRLNNAIAAEFVRLVTAEGHKVVSRREALHCAMKAKLDLVEVQRNAKPPVCKIMDYHRETYKQQQKEKERLKSKSSTLRQSVCKEVRFTKKTEQKDLKMKADMVKRLMERGYRVKCVVTRVEEKDELGELLSNLFALIEDITFVESGPRVDSKQAYAIVRHIKFGSTKKTSGKKAAKIAADAGADVQQDATLQLDLASPISPQTEEWEPTESGSETEDEILSDNEVMSCDSSEISLTSILEKCDDEIGVTDTWSTSDVGDDFDKVFRFDGDGSSTTSRIADHGTVSGRDTSDPQEDNLVLSKVLPIRNQGWVRDRNKSGGRQALKQIPEDMIAKPRSSNGQSAEELRPDKIPSFVGDNWDRSELKNRFQPMKSADKGNGVNESKVQAKVFTSEFQRSQTNQSPDTRWHPRPVVNVKPPSNLNSTYNSSLRNGKPPSDQPQAESPNQSPNARWHSYPVFNVTPPMPQNLSTDNASIRNVRQPSNQAQAESANQSLNTRWHPRPVVNVSPPMPQNLQSTDNASLRNLNPPSNQAQVESNPGASLSSYGIFSSKTTTTIDQKASTEAIREKERNNMNSRKTPGLTGIVSNQNPQKPVAGTQNADETRKGGFGLFSQNISGPK